MTLPESEDVQPDAPPPKRLKLDDTSQASTSSSKPGFLSFCDDIMLEIFSFVKPTDLLALSQCCQRLRRVAFDRTLWNSVDFRSSCLVDSELQKFVQFFLPSTKFIATKGPWKQQAVPCRGEEPQVVVEPSISAAGETATFSGELLENIAKAAPNLTTLILENHIIDSRDLTWDKVPPKLEHLSLRSCHLLTFSPPQDSTNHSFFFRIDKYLPQLKNLDLTACRWFESHSLLALSKCKQLEELRLAECLLWDFVPYVSLGTRFGFKALTVVDLRRTWVSDREVSCLNKTPNLQELYLESPGGSRGASMITDIAITAFGGTLEEWREMGYIVVLMPQFQGFLPSPLRVIQMCGYIGVTDTSLRHCASCLKHLQRINVRGTSCTETGVLKFKAQRPEVVIESDFDLEVEPESSSSVDNT